MKEGKIMIALGCDHGGYPLMKEVIKYLESEGLEYKNFGTYSDKSCDYPVYAKLAANAVANGECDKGIVICGTGIGISIVANKIKGIRCALCSDCFSAKAAREHNNANMLAFGARVIGPGLAIEIVKTFLNTEFSNEERHIRRISQIED
jgi:ribose 5-phosphate isomerase B